MIVTLTGRVAEKLADLVVLDVGGLGYGLYVTFDDFAKLIVGEEAKVYIYEHIRENSHDLFGFTAVVLRDLFVQLLDVNGVGPKMALSIMNLGSPSEVRTAIANGDVKYLQQANGVGRRVAERVVVDLKDKVGLPGRADHILTSSRTKKTDEAVQALVALGYSTHDAMVALDEVPADLSTEERVKQALKG
jgi:holliday junction DNA helicase RuvA